MGEEERKRARHAFELVSKKASKFSNGGHQTASCMVDVGEFRRKSKTDPYQGSMLRLLTSDQKREKDGKRKVTLVDLECRGVSVTEALEAAVCVVFFNRKWRLYWEWCCIPTTPST